MFLWDAVVGSAAPLPGSQTSIALESRERYDSHDLSSRIIRKESRNISHLFAINAGNWKGFLQIATNVA